jgi:RNA polymerase sigma-70 factor (ECF subfamily)
MPTRDGKIVARVLAGDGRAADELFDTHWPRVWRIAAAVTGSRTIAEDAAQEAMIRAFARLEEFDRDRDFAPWVGRIATRCAIDAVRRKPTIAALHDLPEQAGPVQPQPDEAVLAAVAALDDDRRVVVALRYWAGLSVSEIADALDVPNGTVASRLQRAIEELRTHVVERDHR